ncbi:hypothetical protein BJF78_24655 [Pseudonocardia sp. CNS-139]|nr:hypothetical protein BJF78_24655 [Pseudonocardia sp. CNS-139]
MTELDNTAGCPLGVRCESCGLEADDLAVVTVECALGVMCLTMCRRCGTASAETTLRAIAISTASRLVMQHAGHLGITVDDMRLLQNEGGRRPWAQPGYRWVQ